jgi:hypothetical protein
MARRGRCGVDALCVPSLAADVEGHDRLDLLSGTEIERF